ncbi:hypothetical protein [uncultured Maritimibacter sp.]|jgi:hypothetical protein|uniref:hypothetical protein n=1 Tax=uncultured Maritimibacter sp. TaxID=991866 RepID=UPI00261967F5|nr:hypothetical protein [uncultured Maritimibacter sp.]
MQQVDQVAIFTRRVIGSGPGLTPAFRLQSDGETLPLRSRGVANLPIIALLASLEEILAAETLGPISQIGREVCDAAPRAHAATSEALAPTGCSARTLVSASMPFTGMNTRVFHWITSVKHPMAFRLGRAAPDAPINSSLG